MDIFSCRYGIVLYLLNLSVYFFWVKIQPFFLSRIHFSISLNNLKLEEYVCIYIDLVILQQPKLANEKFRKNTVLVIYPRTHELSQIGLVGRVFANSPGDMGSTPGRVLPRALKMVLDTSSLNTQQYKVCIKDKVKQSRERSSALPYTSVS